MHFVTKVLPVIKAKCLACHGDDPDDLKGGLDLRTSDLARKGGDSGEAAWNVERPLDSPIYRSITRNDDSWSAMPPKENDALTEQEVKDFLKWIEQGATWPDEERLRELLNQIEGEQRAKPHEVRVTTTPGLSVDWTNRTYQAEDLWAYRPLSKVSIPEVGCTNPIDVFIHQKLNESSLEPATPADSRSLVRRITMDLTGLPATIEAESDGKSLSDREYHQLVDQLLDSPAYGEQMARRWLDVVRYADTAGFANDYERPNVWRYRDYVIRSFQNDKPFDRFITEQIAGDELAEVENATGEARSEMLIATSFLRLGPWEHTAMSVEAETRQQWLDDVVNSIGNSFLGLEMSCFRCHDHKFDPLPTRDYYAMQAIFAPVQFADLKVPFLEREEASIEAQNEHRERLESLKKSFKANKIKKDTKTAARRIERWPQAFVPLVSGIYKGPSRLYSSEKMNFLPPEESKRQGDVMPVHLLRRGALADPVEEMQPSCLSAVHSLSNESFPPTQIPAESQRRRFELAKWIASPQNPLTARVIVNRVWGWHFGNRPLVATPNDFGVKGAKPTHPELLDWLAGWFIENGWSIKALDRLIVTSEAYRRSLHHPRESELNQIDPERRLLASFPMRRLTAEEMRDAMLFASGELNPQAGGPPARPQMNWDAAQSPVTLMPGPDIPYRPSLTPDERNRRSIYALHMRSRRDPWMEVFDQPASELFCDRRNESTIVPQAISLMNGDFTNDRSLALAQRLRKKFHDDRDCIEAIYRSLYGRGPSEDERCIAGEYLSAQTGHHRHFEPSPSRVPEIVAEVSKYEPKYSKQYVADLQPCDTTAEVRALADLCLVLFNSSEFLFLP